MTKKIFDGKDFKLSEGLTLEKRKPQSLKEVLGTAVGVKKFSSLDKLLLGVQKDLGKFNGK